MSNEHMEGPEPRAETGAMQFGDDWPGVFFRGDNALYFMLRLRDVLQRSNITDMDRIVLSQLADLLGSCEVGGKEPYLRTYSNLEESTGFDPMRCCPKTIPHSKDPA